MECWNCKDEMTHFINKKLGIISGFVCSNCGCTTITQVTGSGEWVFVEGRGFLSTTSDFERFIVEVELSK